MHLDTCTSRKRFQSTLPAWGATSNRRDRFGSKRFQSTLPAWGATLRGVTRRSIESVSIHAPRVGSDPDDRRESEQGEVSIHAPRVGSDRQCDPEDRDRVRFQSTLPAWGATGKCPERTGYAKVSIHAPRVGSDQQAAGVCSRRCCFNPRSPRGERLRISFETNLEQGFNPRSPRGERTREEEL